MKIAKVFLLAVLFLSASVLAISTLTACNQTDGGTSDSGYQPGEIVADWGLRAKPNGFKFENYGNTPVVSNLTSASIRKMFGDKVCGSLANSTCILTPPAEEWMKGLNGKLDGGHCEGMSVLSMLMFAGKVKASDFGGQTAYELDSTSKLQSEIAYWATTQYVSPTKEFIVGMTPNDFVNKLIEGLKKTPVDETWDIGIFSKSMGHAVTPSYIKSLGNGKLAVMVYDNNHPGVEREMLVDTNANTLSYKAALNPSKPEEEWIVNASNQNIVLIPSNPRLNTQACPFCSISASAKLKAVETSYLQIWIEGDADLEIADSDGNKIGIKAGELFNQMPGAKIIRTLSGTFSSPVFEIPEGKKLTATLDGSSLTSASITDLSLVAHGYTLSVDGVNLNPGDKDTITFSADGKELSYQTASPETPELSIGFEADGPDWDFDMHASCNSTSTWKVTMKLNLSEKKVLATFASEAGATMQFDLDAYRIDENGEIKSNHPGYSVNAGETLTIDYSTW